MFQKTTLDNGLRIITAPMPYAHSVSIALFLGAGSRYESVSESGLSHFVEHLCFKGTHLRPTAKVISEAIEGVGGVLNGGTDKEVTVYWCKVARPHFLLALDVLSDMLRHSLFDTAEIEKERHVITEEINMSWDSPAHRVDLLIDEILWPEHPLGRDVAGNKEIISGMGQDMLVDYVARQYLPNTTVIGVAGSIDHQEVVSAIGEKFQDWHKGSPTTWIPAIDNQVSPQIKIEHKDTEQAHLCLALRGLPLLHPDRYVLDLLNVMLGEGMSSRLFQEIRENQSLAYDIHSYLNYFQDTGTLIIGAGVDPRQLHRTINAVLVELLRLKGAVPEDELKKVKEMTKGRMLLRLEDSRSMAGWFAAQELLTNHIRTVDDMVSIIDSVTVEDIERLANQLLVTEKLNLAVVGPVQNGDILKEVLHF